MIGAYRFIGSTADEFSASRTARSCRLVAIGLFILIAALDLCWPNVNFSMLFSVPLLLLARASGRVHWIWWYLALLVVSVYSIYFVKYQFIHQQSLPSLWNFRLFNRTFAVIMLTLLGIAAQAWIFWQYERTQLSYLDRSDEDEVNATAGLVGCVGLGLLITAIDFVSPANYNLPILFVVPLYLVSWLRNQRCLWAAAAIFICLTWIGFFLTPSSTVLGFEHYLIINRALVSLALVALSTTLSWLIWRRDRDPAEVSAIENLARAKSN